MAACAYKFLAKYRRFLAMYFLLFIMLILELNSLIYGQISQINLSVSSGGFPNFKFTTFNQLNFGMPLPNYTTLKLRYIWEQLPFPYTLNSSAKWRLKVRALDPSILGSEGNTITVDRIQLQVVSMTPATRGTILPSVTVANWLTVTNSFSTLIDLGVNDYPDVDVLISYYVGRTPNIILGEPPDYYIMYLEFVLEDY